MPKKISDIEHAEDNSSLEAPSNLSATPNTQKLRVATIIELNHIDDITAGSVMAAHSLKSSDRIEPLKFMQMVEEFKKRKISKTGRK